MLLASHQRPAKGFSLIELLCVIAIISILMGMMIGPVLRAYNRAKAFEGEIQSPPFHGEIVRALSEFCENYREYKALTPEELAKIGVFDGNVLAFLRSNGVRYHPFSSSDPGSKVIVQVNKGRKASFIIRKHDVVPR